MIRFLEILSAIFEFATHLLHFALAAVQLAALII
jgi:hypothetical protein